MMIKNVLLSSTQVLKGDIREAICTHALYYAIWKKYEAMPERFNWQTKQSEVHFSPLRPELIESTYLLHQVRCLINRRSRRRGGLMVSALDFGWRGLGPSPGRVVLWIWANYFTLAVFLSTQECIAYLINLSVCHRPPITRSTSTLAEKS